MQLLYQILFWPVRVVMFLWHPTLHVYGKENLPEGGAVYCSNHCSGSDPLWIIFALHDRQLPSFLAKQELRKIPLIGWLLEKLGIVFVRRGQHDVRAYDSCVHTLRQDKKLVVFIEGTRCSHNKHVRAKRGAFHMAMQGGKPVVPLYVTRRRTLFSPISVYFGKPFTVPEQTDRESLQRIADETLWEIYKMGGDTDYADYICKNCGLLLRG